MTETFIGGLPDGGEVEATDQIAVDRDNNGTISTVRVQHAKQSAAEIVALLQALTGNNRLNATALRLIADAINAELGSALWRSGLTAAQTGILDGLPYKIEKSATASQVTLALIQDTEDPPTQEGVFETATTDAAGFMSGDHVSRILPTFPSTGDRDNKVAKFSGDTLNWEVDETGTGGGLTTDQVNTLIQAALTAAVTGNTETRIIVSHNSDGTLDFVVDDILTTEEINTLIQNALAAAVTNNTETRIAVTHNTDGTLDFVVDEGLTNSDVDTRIQTALAAAVTNNTETGITVTHNSDGTLDFVVGPAAPPLTHTRYVGWSSDSTIETADLDASLARVASFTTDELTIPSESTNGYLFFAVPSSPGYPDQAFFDGNTHDILGGFAQQSGTINDSNGDAHVVGVTTSTQSAAILGTGSRTLTLDYD